MKAICWYSCGDASAVASKIALKKYKCRIIYCDTGSEHEDNKRFLTDCEKWLDQKIEIHKNEKYIDIWDVFKKTRYLVGIHGARCTTELKKSVRNKIQDLDAVQVFGFTVEEIDRAERFKKNNPEVKSYFPLIENDLNKADCHAIIQNANIQIPQMYKLGYRNNNCIGCPKGQSGYWNKIRNDFPDIFLKMAELERELNVAINKTYAGDGQRKRIFLDELPEDMGDYPKEPDISCGLSCGVIINDL